MADRAAPAVFSVPAHRPFADALAEGLIARTGSDRLALARGLVLVPNNRAARAITDAFVRRAEGGLLLPRLVAIGDPDLDETLGQALDPADSAEPLPPAIDPMVRRMMLARIVAEERVLAGEAGRCGRGGAAGAGAGPHARPDDRRGRADPGARRSRGGRGTVRSLAARIGRDGGGAAALACGARPGKADRSRRSPQPAARSRRGGVARAAAAGLRRRGGDQRHRARP